MNKNGIKQMFTYLLSIFCGFCFVNCTNNEIAKMEDAWREFRSLHPYSYQTVALKHYGDTCVFIMSEPDCWVKESELEQLFDKYDGQLILRYQPYGYDGQLTDAVGCAILDSISFHEFEKELFTLLYKTDYKPYYTDLDHPIKHIYYSKDYNLNYTISPFIIESDLNEVFIAPSQDGTNREKTVTELLQSDMGSSNEIYFSKDRGFLIWVFNTDSIIQEESFLQNARRFSLDSDLIFGSIPQKRNNNKLAIVAREREVPIYILPPLRSGTLFQLASNTGVVFELTFGTETLINDTTYAAPISMTSCLENTELGNLMVITDVLLKSWSENGRVSDYFIDYPMPVDYPFINGASQELGYNPKYLWRFFFDGVTGCMPLGYYPEPQDSTATDTEKKVAYIARKQFANLNCIDLIRATQYAAIYQLFNGFYLKCQKQTDNWIKTPSLTISNKPWGLGGCVSQSRNLLKGLKARRIFRPEPNPWRHTLRFRKYLPIVNSSPISDNPKLIDALARNPELKDVLHNKPELEDIIIHHPKVADLLSMNRPNLAIALIEYPKFADVLEKHPKLADLVEKHPKFAYILPASTYPKLADTLEIHPELADVLEEYPELSEVVLKHPQLVGALVENLQLANILGEKPKLIDLIVKHIELADAVSNYPTLADELTRTPQLVDVLVKHPSLADEMERFLNHADFSAINPHFIELLSKYPKVELRENLNISSSTDVQRGLDFNVHTAPASKEYILSKIEIQETKDVSTQRINKMIEMRLQIKQELIKKGIHSKEVLWEINNTLRAFIILDQYDEKLNQAA